MTIYKMELFWRCNYARSQKLPQMQKYLCIPWVRRFAMPAKTGRGRIRKSKGICQRVSGATAQEVSAETGVSTHLIYRFLKEGRLEVAESSPIALQCENCGTRIKSGRFCITCSKRLANDMIRAGQSLMSKSDEKTYKSESRGLRYLHGERKDEN